MSRKVYRPMLSVIPRYEQIKKKNSFSASVPVTWQPVVWCCGQPVVHGTHCVLSEIGKGWESFKTLTFKENKEHNSIRMEDSKVDSTRRFEEKKEKHVAANVVGMLHVKD